MCIRDSNAEYMGSRRMNHYRSLFLSHGAPTLATSQHPANAFLRELGKVLPKPKAVIVVSPHWMTRGFPVKQADRYQAWHDFGGFPAELYRLQYAPTGDAALADRVQAAIDAAGLPTARDTNPQIDHGVWVPLLLMWPDADVPLVQVSTSTGDAAAHWALGVALRSLLDDDGDTLLIGSGSLVHNLREIEAEYAPAPDWSRAFDGWISDKLIAHDQSALLDYRKQAPNAARAHPTDDHLMPLFTAAASGGGPATKLHESFSYGGLSMSAYGWPVNAGG
eukprot:TRINITY_DN7962_c0_g1_i2.p1 TRINITY_DN7962_c0_g1~~TRINITY_DN7962_c0_g1_i2.p1  ORF type:complete len:278 (-),score=59.64 TRINITY_DN7962_c0_g1_i2:566-1399(-)